MGISGTAMCRDKKRGITNALSDYQGERNGWGGFKAVYNVMSVFADDLIKSTSFIKWCNFIFYSYLCVYIVPCVQQQSSSQNIFYRFVSWVFCLLAVTVCLEELSAATAEYWRKQSNRDRIAKYYVSAAACAPWWVSIWTLIHVMAAAYEIYFGKASNGGSLIYVAYLSF